MLLGARQFFEKRGSALPYDAEVEYIQSSGTQYIDTGIVPNNNLGFILDVAYVGDGGVYGRLFGTQANGYAGSVAIRRVNASSGDIQFQSIGTGISGKYAAVSYGTNRMMYGFNEPQGAFCVDGTEITTGVAISAGITYSAWLFGTNNVAQYGLAKLYSFKAINHSNGSFVADMIPVRFTNELGQSEGAMYDRVSGALFRNAGTGAFTIGPDKTAWTNPYVTNGLVAMWDGEWNAGGGVHDPNATVWKDLSGNNYNLTNFGAVVSSDHFTTSSVGILYGNFTISNVVSIECVCREFSTAKYSMCVCINSAAQAIARQNRLLLASNRSGWCERGFSCATDEVNALSFMNVGTSDLFGAQNGVVSTLQSGSTDWSGNMMVSVGGRKRAGQNPDYYSNGDYYCVRLYNHALTAAEISANYAIDKARFNLP